MKKKFKRICSFILVICLMCSMIPVENVFAKNKEVKEQSKNQTKENDTINSTMDYSGVTMQGTNDFGTLLSKEITETQAQEEVEENHSEGYTITDLVVENNQAIVTYSSLEDVMLMVALYSEDGLEMLLSANTMVKSNEKIGKVEFNAEIPKYFLAKAYLVDTYDLSPLCAEYSTPMYTREMQELLSSTVEDYDTDKILNFDGDNTTNFAVYADTTTVIDKQEGINKVTSINEENATYVIENADESITSLQVGEVFAYPYEQDELLLVKVASIAVNGTTATITGDNLEIEEVFSHVKLETEGSTSDISVDESTIDDGITYLGVKKDETEKSADVDSRAIEGELDGTLGHEFQINKKFVGDSSSVGVYGKIKFEFKVAFSYYVTFQRQYINFKADTSLGIHMGVEGKLTEALLTFGSFGYSPIPGVFIGFEPEFRPEFSAKAEWNCIVSFTLGVKYESGQEPQNLCTTPSMESKMNFEGKIFLGIDMNPKISVCQGALTDIRVTGPIGLEMVGKLTGTDYEVDSGKKEGVHACAKCLKGTLSTKVELNVIFKFLKCKKFDINAKIFSLSTEIGKFYYSFDNNQFEFGECPNYTYRLTIVVKDSEGNLLKDVPVSTSEGESWGTTNGNGVRTKYVPEGSYVICAEIGEKQLKKKVIVTDACKVVLEPAKENDNSGENEGNSDNIEIDFGGIIGNIESESNINGKIIAKGECGEKNSDVKWKFYSNGLLLISGTGSVKDYVAVNYVTSSPWYWDNNIRQNLKKIVVEEGVTGIGWCAFSGLNNLEKVILKDSNILYAPAAPDNYGGMYWQFCGSKLRTAGPIGSGCDLEFAWNEKIPDRAFEYSSIQEIIFPETLKTVGSYSFEYSSIQKIMFPETLTDIGEKAFQGCKYLSSIVIPGTLKRVGKNAFNEWPNLKTIGEIGSGCNIEIGGTSIPSNFLEGANDLTTVTIPSTVNEIGDSVFKSCQGLNKIIIPESVTAIWANLCYDCPNIINAGPIGSGSNIEYAWKKEIPPNAFRGCNTLEKIELPEMLQVIGGGAFQNCSKIVEMTLGKNVTSLGAYAFSGCTNLESIELPANLSNIGRGVFRECSKLKTAGPIGSENNIKFAWNERIPDCAFEETYIENIILPNELVYIGKSAFESCVELKNLTLPNGVKEIGASAFSGCTGVSTIVLPDSVEEIGASAFSGCTKLSIVSLSKKLHNLSDFLFYGCTAIENISIPASIKSIGKQVFLNCSKLSQIRFVGSNQGKISSNAFEGVTAIVEYPENDVSWEENQRLNYGGVLTWQPYDNTITNGYGTSIKSGTCGDTLSWMLYDSGSLVISGTGTMWAKNSTSFWSSETDNIIEVYIEEGVTSIGERAFEFCENLRNITFPSTLKKIGHNAFYTNASENLENVYISNLKDWCNVEIPSYAAHPMAYADNFYVDGVLLTEINVPNGITEIKDFTFYGLSKVTSVSLPNTVTKIGKYSFAWCDAFSSLSVPESVMTIESSSFANCKGIKEITFCGNAPQMESDAFLRVEATAYYLENNDSWSSAVLSSYGGTLTWVPYARGERSDKTSELKIEDGSTNAMEKRDVIIKSDTSNESKESRKTQKVRKEEKAVKEEKTLLTDAISPYSVNGGEYESEVEENYTMIKASFKELVPGEKYIVFAAKSLTISNPLESKNLLYVNQGIALEDGTLEFRYIQRENIDNAYVIACGASNKNLKDAVVTFPEMVANGEAQIVEPIVTYNDQTLEEGKDYIIVGSVEFMEAGNYTCFVRGVRNYTGLLEGNYAVADKMDSMASGICGENLIWELSYSGILTVSGDGEMTNYSSSSSKRAPWYEYCDMITSVVLKGNVTSIGNYAFYNCIGIKKINIPDSVIQLGDYTFYGCTALTDITFPKGITSIGKYVFYNCKGIKTINIPDSVTQLGNYTFYGCTALTDITIPNSVAHLGDYTFYGCTALTDITFPKGIISIGNDTFYRCSNLGKVSLSETLTSVGNEAFGECKALKNIELPSGLETLGRSTFYKCVGLEKVVLLGNVTSGDSLFVGCEKLQTAGPLGSNCNIEFAWNQNIPNRVFDSCYSITSVIIPEGIISIGDSAFGECNITEMTIPEGVTSIGNYAFDSCKKLEVIQLPDSLSSIGKGAFRDCISLISVRVPDYVTIIGDECFAGCVLMEEIVIGNAVTSIGASAFGSCTALKNISIPSSVQIIGNGAFSACKSLIDVKMVNGVTQIGNSAFANCILLTDIIIPNSVTQIGNYAFSGCIALTDIIIPDSVTQIGNYAFSGCSNIANLEFGKNISSIDYYAFKDCKSLERITIPENVTKIGNYVFSGCSELKKVVLLNENTVFGTGVFSECEKLQIAGCGGGEYNIEFLWKTKIPENVFTNCESLIRVEMPESITEIGNRAFQNCIGLKEVVLSSELKNIGDNAFTRCKSLEEITFPSKLVNMGKSAFSECIVLGKVRIPSNIINISSGLFSGCTGLSSLIIENGVETIGANAFARCTNLSRVEIPESVKEAREAFSNCTGLTKVILHATNVVINLSTCSEIKTAGPIGSGCDFEFAWKESIPAYAFSGNDYLLSVILPEEINTIEEYAFNSCDMLQELTIPKNVVRIERNAFSGCRGLKNVIFVGDVPEFGNYVFSSVVTTVYYPADNLTWTDEVMQNYGGTLTWKPRRQNVFTDVKETEWFYSAAMYVSSNGIMGGLTADTFGPTKTLTRAQFATILYQLGGKPEVEYTKKFSDIPKGEWFTDGVLWANSIGVVGGYNNGTFGPNDNITREQMALMMYNYAKYKGYDLSKTADISSYSDASKVNSYTKEAMKWAVGNQIIGGKAGNKLDPQGKATRAECAVIMMQFVEKNAK